MDAPGISAQMIAGLIASIAEILPLVGAAVWLGVSSAAASLQVSLMQGLAGFTDGLLLENSLPWLAMVGAFGKKSKTDDAPALFQEKPGFHLSISSDVDSAGSHASDIARERYDNWVNSDWSNVDSRFKHEYFSIAVGGGNTVKSEFRALLEKHAFDINWIEHVRFFFLEESSRDSNWKSSKDALTNDFIRPLASKLITRYGGGNIISRLGMDNRTSEEEIVDAMLDTMTYAIDMKAVDEAMANGDSQLAGELAHQEAQRYQQVIRELVGDAMAFHIIISGIDKDGGIGAFSTYTPELKQKKPAVVVLDKANGTVIVALNRGVLIAAQCISLIISGSLKLKALGRFEMEDGDNFEKTVMETPIRMLRATREIAEKVYIFADERSLYFDEGMLQYQEQGETIEVKSEVREGQEDGGVHILLVHGFMGLYSYINLLIRLPSAWKVSALHRGKYAKQLPDEEVFPHYARALRKVILQNWRYGRPTPVGFHSMAGVISDHLLLSILKDYQDELPDFEQLEAEDQQLIEALRASGMIHLATWAPTDVCHIADTIANLKAHMSKQEPLNYSGPASVYNINFDGDLELNSLHCNAIDQRPPFMEKMMKFLATEAIVNALTVGIRHFLAKKDLQKLLSRRETPYALRVIGSRLLKKISFYGLLKEVNASLHDPYEYQRRHFLALDAIIKYDIPYITVIHKDDFMVSANRHTQEHEYLLTERMEKEGVKRAQDLETPTRLVLLERSEQELLPDPLNPHLLVMSTTHDGDRIAREVTTAITEFVNGNVARAVAAGTFKPLSSVSQWLRKQKRAQAKSATATATATATEKSRGTTPA